MCNAGVGLRQFVYLHTDDFGDVMSYYSWTGGGGRVGKTVGLIVYTEEEVDGKMTSTGLCPLSSLVTGQESLFMHRKTNTATVVGSGS